MRILTALVLLLGCDDSTSGSDSGTDAGSDSAFDSAIDSEPCGECDAVDFFVEVGGEPLADGRVVDWVWGFQGGTMITPTLVFTDGVTVGETIEVEVRHDPDPAAPELFGEGEDFRGPYTYFYEVYRNADRVVAGPIDDQLGWIDLDGMRLIHSVRVRAARGTTTRTAAIEMATSEPTPCDVFEIRRGECNYYLIPGTASITVGDPDPLYSTCTTDPRSVRMAFAPDDMDAAAACAESRGLSLELEGMFTVFGGTQPPASCLDEAGLVDGTEVPATMWLIRNGTCTPITIHPDSDTSACDEMCY